MAQMHSNLPDMLNGIFEFGGSLLLWASVWRLRRDKKVRGVYVPAWAWFFLWGIWNLYYYPHLAQWMSFLGGCSIVLANGTWLVLAFIYRNK